MPILHAGIWGGFKEILLVKEIGSEGLYGKAEERWAACTPYQCASADLGILAFW